MVARESSRTRDRRSEMWRRNSEAGVGRRQIPVYRGVAKKEGKTVTRSQPAEFVAEGGTGSVPQKEREGRGVCDCEEARRRQRREPDLGRRNEDYRGWEIERGKKREAAMRCDAVRRAGG